LAGQVVVSNRLIYHEQSISNIHTMNMRQPSRRNSANATAKRKRLTRGTEILQQTSIAIQALADSLDEDFIVAVEKILSMRGNLIVCGIGKAGLIGRKIAATFASTGTRAHFLHPAEAVHGDLGSVGPNDVVLMLSNSGATEEIVRLLPFMVRRAAGLIAITSGANSPLARAADISLILPPCREACQHNLAPSTSTASMLAIGDALALVVSEAKGFGVEDFAEFHPGGSLGRKLLSVDEAMRSIDSCRIASCNVTVREMIIDAAKPGRRTGAIMLCDSEGKLEGIFTDSDLAKLLEQRREADLDRSISELMTRSFSAVQSGAKLTDAIDIMTKRKISELPVVDGNDRPQGLVDITDILGMEYELGMLGALENLGRLDESDLEGVSSEFWRDAPTTLRIFGSHPDEEVL
jgi:arabinose-5-phosphate isomerase